MSLRKPAKEQPEKFEFTTNNLAAAKEIVSKYPEGKQQSAVMALLYIAQKQNYLVVPCEFFLYSSVHFSKNYI